jgi:hypothetical protein
MKHGA